MQQVQEYTHAKKAFESFDVNKNKKFNKRNAIKILRNLCKIILKHNYENDPKELEEYNRQFKRYEGYAKERNMSDKEEKKFIEKNVIKKFEKHIGQRIREKMRDWTDWKHLKFQSTHNNGPLQFQRERVKFAITKGKNFLLYRDCYYNDNDKELEKIINILTENNIVITSFIKKYPKLVGCPGTDRPKCTPFQGEEPGHDGLFSIHRGNLVGFIIHQNNV